MKIALCFSGQPRAFKTGYEFHKRNLLDHYDVDIYFHSWNTSDNQEYLELYKPVAYRFDDQVTANLDRYTRTPQPLKHPKINTYSMYYTMNESRKLLNGNYDWVIRSRTDYALNVKFDFANLDNTKLHLPDDYIPASRDTGNDQFAFSSMENMIKYMSTFENIDRYYDAGTIFNGEDLMSANLRHHGLINDRLEYVNMNNPFPPNQWGGLPNSLIRDDFLRWNPGVTDW